ncbi:J domain-containing protein [Vibrio coralliilyticus]|uniref:J domain-containing protein n=2 Tax=Vibrio coralliilyticus TaxID=190893 RepID=UPI000BAABB53|nr:J domain-containing protein [Vibrio coralliilyticus]NOI58989.1 J domain-containing protein [Vibrio coralliilyticus]PAT66761.1 J domain-containing protein [Vibrio coralliilyticus]
MLDMFVTAHCEQRAVLYAGRETLSDKTARIMLRRLDTEYYTRSEHRRVKEVLTKLGYLAQEKSREAELLDKANETIRKANARIHELKQQRDKAERSASELKIQNQVLQGRLMSAACSLSDKDILGYESLPSGPELRKRYKNLAAIHHPDKGGSKTMMQRLNDSYEKLKAQVA